MISKSQIKVITPEEADDMYKLLTDSDMPGENMPEGLYMWPNHDGTWTACDNLDGYAWTEDFRTRHAAEHYLLGW